MYVLDTNAYSSLVKDVGVVAELVVNEPELAIAFPAVAELRYGFVHGDRAQDNEAKLQAFLAQPNVHVLTPGLETTRYYAEIQQFCKQRGRALSQNDIWIAALVRESSDTLLTFDKDFEALRNLLDGRIKLLEQ
jgi:predicted nucleic acid-binding protein